MAIQDLFCHIGSIQRKGWRGVIGAEFITETGDHIQRYIVVPGLEFVSCRVDRKPASIQGRREGRIAVLQSTIYFLPLVDIRKDDLFVQITGERWVVLDAVIKDDRSGPHHLECPSEESFVDDRGPGTSFDQFIMIPSIRSKGIFGSHVVNHS
jgi:hypothetical protein